MTNRINKIHVKWGERKINIKLIIGQEFRDHVKNLHMHLIVDKHIDISFLRCFRKYILPIGRIYWIQFWIWFLGKSSMSTCIFYHWIIKPLPAKIVLDVIVLSLVY
jgi:hypothetical protein